MLQYVKLMFNMKQSKEYLKQFATFNSRIFLFISSKIIFATFFPAAFCFFKEIIKVLSFLRQPYSIYIVALRGR